MTNEAVTAEVLGKALWWQENGTPALTPEKIASTVERLKGGSEQEGVSLEEYALKYVDQLDVTPPRPDTASCFWSWRVRVDHPTDPGKGKVDVYNQHIARAQSDLENNVVKDSMRYLEGTPGGEELSDLYLWEPRVQAALQLDVDTGEGNEFAGRVWDALSRRYAQQTTGEALFFMEEMSPGTVAYQTESSQLRRDGKLDQIRFMHPPPQEKLQGFSPEIQELLSSDAVRAQVHTFAYDENDPKYTPLTKAGHLDLDHLRSLPTPEAQRAAVLEVCARVATMDGRQADAQQLIEEIQTLAPDHEVTLPDSADLAWAVSDRMKYAPEQAVSTHGQFLPGVAVHGRTGPSPSQQGQGVADGNFLVGVAPAAKPLAAPVPAAAGPGQGPHTVPTVERTNDAGLAM